MRAVIQRVLSAQVEVGPADAREVVAEMGRGLLVLVGVGQGDTELDGQELIRKIVTLRVFEDASGKMNLSLGDIGGTLGLVSQFTLWADLRKGRRPSFGDAADQSLARPLFDATVAYAHNWARNYARDWAQDCPETRSEKGTGEQGADQGVPIVTGRFGEHMKVSLVNDGPVTLLLDTEKRF